MQNPCLTALCLLAVSACTSPYGNYASTSDSYNAQMADDSVHELTMLYPPAATHLALLQPAKDAYGVELVKELRSAGYAIEDNAANPAPVAATSGSTADAHNRPIIVEPSAPVKATTGKSLGYVVDNLAGGLYRVTLSIDAQTVSRVYSVTGQDMLPAGAWTRKE